ncbi:MAG: hypothetical protein JOZ98_06605 [Solirubrobacterales bacterium]|nr:hypothetical protein [Solirubrobacterales bacterium]MBV9422561.1 hypothetical protein [Solirubrobacterales bacterium]MBV9801348.1 hypothetical protein [Solirubrobacterales bacterium]
MLDRVELRNLNDVLEVLPTLPPEPFSTRDLASLLGCNMLVAQRTADCLRVIKIVEPAGKRSRTPLHPRSPEAARPT